MYQLGYLTTAFAEDEVVDLASEIGARPDSHDQPYVLERGVGWALFPLLMIGLILLHLRSERRSQRRTKPSAKIMGFSALFAFFMWGKSALAVEFENLYKAIAATLGTTKASKKKIGTSEIYMTQAPSNTVAVVERGTWEPNCTHTWVIGVEKKTAAVKQIRVIEMSCPHAFPTKDQGFLSQFIGKGIKDLKVLDTSLSAIAKATGSSKLTRDAVKRAIQAVSQLQK